MRISHHSAAHLSCPQISEMEGRAEFNRHYPVVGRSGLFEVSVRMCAESSCEHCAPSSSEPLSARLFRMAVVPADHDTCRFQGAGSPRPRWDHGRVFRAETTRLKCRGPQARASLLLDSKIGLESSALRIEARLGPNRLTWHPGQRAPGLLGLSSGTRW